MPKKGATMSAKDAIGTEQQLNFYTATSVQLGNLVVENMNVSTLSTLSDEVKCYANGGIIGGNFMRHYHRQIDYENKRLIVSSDFSRLSIPQDAIRADAIVSLPQGAVVLEDILVGGKEEEFTLDTGNSGYINLGMERWDLKKTGENSSYAEAHGYSNLGTGGRQIITSSTIRTSFAAPMDTMQNAIIQVDTENSLLGNRYLSQFGLITINYSLKNGAVYFNRKKAEAPNEMTYGFVPVYQRERNAFVMGKIYQGSEAGKTGLKVDDTILAINGKELSHVAYATYCSNLNAGVPSYVLEGDAVTLTVLKDGKPLDYTFRKYPLFNAAGASL